MKKRQKKSSLSREKRMLSLLGSNIRRIRGAKKVYDLCGDDMPIKSRQHWQLIENGKKNVSFVTVVKIAQTLEVDLSELLTGL